MPDLSIVVACSRWEELTAAVNAVNRKLPLDCRRRLNNIFFNYLVLYGNEGVYERLNGRTVAEIFRQFDDSDEIMPLPSAGRGTWDNVRTIASEGIPGDLLALECPKCGGKLSIRFDANSPQASGGTAGCLMIRCLDCASGCCWDGLSQSPPWVSSLGPKVETQPKPRTEDCRDS